MDGSTLEYQLIYHDISRNKEPSLAGIEWEGGERMTVYSVGRSGGVRNGPFFPTGLKGPLFPPVTAAQATMKKYSETLGDPV